MFLFLVTRRLRRAVAALSRADAGPASHLLARRCHFSAIGVAGFAAPVNSSAAMQRRLRAVLTNFPSVRFVCDQVAVQGPAWAAVVACHLIMIPCPSQHEAARRFTLLLTWRWTKASSALLLSERTDVATVLRMLAAESALVGAGAGPDSV
ncbi:hypothetical protein OOK41_22000 [Micromonospora sp. NBC_01655]|uniref:hypothetical protein n=1 Tax=unclassified Micromonospora TaxID=2617518 RepID=UPI000FFEBB23|nr:MULTISPECIES: hypothetical protein [unclassified Micromonospora]MCX4472952.1 hypothetical protein [Micromonospora sp. NBC_01655]